MRSEENIHDGYKKYRGKCKEYCDAAVLADPTLTLVRGHYFCPIWNTDEPHWWTVKQDGTIFDPTRLQFPSAGLGIYTPFNGNISCENCGKEVPEKEACIDGHHAFCSSRCYGQFVGVY